MSLDFINQFKIYNIQHEYKIISNYLKKLQYHVNNLNNYPLMIIPIYERNLYIGKIYENIKYLNNTYNELILQEITIISDELNNILLNHIIDDNPISLRKHLININSVLMLKELDKILFPLKKCYSKVINLSSKYGNQSLKIITEMIFSQDITQMYGDKTIEYFQFLNESFIPIRFEIKNKNFNSLIDNSSEENETDNDYFEDINVYLSPLNNDDLLNRIVSIDFMFNNKTLSIEGIFNIDTINIIIKTCQISYKFIYLKKKNLEKSLLKTNATKSFQLSFFKNLSIFELICYNKEEFIDFVNLNFDLYMLLISKSFMNIMKEFIKKNNTLTDMFNTIRLLLLGNEENINVAGLLFEITKDKKINTTFISDIIYRNLCYVSQIKLKEVAISIKDELKRIQSLSINDIDLKKQILTLKFMPLSVKSLAFEKIEEMKSSNNEYYKQMLFVKTLIKFPWPTNSDNIELNEINKDELKRINYIQNIETKLKELTYGHNNAKTIILQTIGRWISKPKSGGSAISFVGPPGVGKTMLAKSIGDALDIPFVQITLGGQNDGELLHGHGYTYSGAQPGMIIKKMIDAGKSRCIMYFDELDKACSKYGSSNEITSVLIHLTDQNMNSSFQDRFFQGIDFPLNNVIMIFSYNDSNLIDPILLDRFKEIEIKPYSQKDKLMIVKNFMFKEICETINFKSEFFTFSDNAIKYLIEKYTIEAGVRDLKRKIEEILLNLNIDRLYQRGLFKKKKNKIIITEKLIISILNKAELDIKQVHSEPLVGVINGLYATTIGTGGIVPIQIMKNNVGKNFILKLTGNQGNVMKESVECALSCALDYINRNKNKYNITDLNEYMIENFPYGFHIHAPSGATPKDGPSAGCAFTSAFISRILDKKINNTLAMTGEIDLVGNITKIGGLEYKFNGAKKAGIKKILISKENEDDYKKIKKEYTSLNIIIINQIDDIIEHLFL